MVVVGPRRGQHSTGDGETRDPARYAHLVEFGHHAPDGSFVAGTPFMRSAFEGEKERMKDIYARNIGTDAMRHAQRLNRRLARRRAR